jgi:tetrapyrrole methylase family protein/MazG family protein
LSLDIARAAALLDALPAQYQRDGAIQIMVAANAFEPNPTVSTLVVGFASAEDIKQALAMLRRSLAPDQSVWVLTPGQAPRTTSLRTLAEAGSLSDSAVYVPAIKAEAAERSLAGLRHVVSRLRKECPWDRKQTHESLAKYTLEEAYEVVDAIEHHGPPEIAEELGDLLLQVFLQSELAEETGEFALNDVVERITIKLIRRHPHVFADVEVSGASDVEANWEALKKAEKAERVSMLDGIPKSLPALAMAAEMQKRMRKAGFEWPDRADVEAKLTEELDELRTAESPAAAQSELGDVLFVLTGLGGWLDSDAESGLRSTNAKVDARFRYVEERIRERGVTMRDVPLADLLALWNEAKSLDAQAP